MKRFLTDAFLVLLLVSLLSYMSEPKAKSDINSKIESFEDTVAQRKPVHQMVDDTYLNSINENGASRLAKAGSDTIINIMETSIDVVSELFQGFMK